MRENPDPMKKFVVEHLQKRLTSYMLISKQMASKFNMLEESFVQALAKEIAEFNEDKKDVAETKVRLVREETNLKVKKNFI